MFCMSLSLIPLKHSNLKNVSFKLYRQCFVCHLKNVSFKLYGNILFVTRLDSLQTQYLTLRVLALCSKDNFYTI